MILTSSHSNFGIILKASIYTMLFFILNILFPSHMRMIYRFNISYIKWKGWEIESSEGVEEEESIRRSSGTKKKNLKLSKNGVTLSTAKMMSFFRGLHYQ